MKHPDYLEWELTEDQYLDWVVFNAISPIGGKRLDTLFAIQTYYMRQALADNKDESPEDLRPKFPIYDASWDFPTEATEEEDEVARQRREASQFR